MSSPRAVKTERAAVQSDIADRSALLLAWYDRHRRRLPWRALPGERADPYRVWLSEIMLQQTGVKTVAPYFEKFVARWPDVDALGRASLDDVLRMWAGLGYYSRARNLHACAVAVLRDHGGVFPDTEKACARCPGSAPIRRRRSPRSHSAAGPCRSTATSSAWSSRLFAVEEPLPQAKPLIQQLAATLLDPVRAAMAIAPATRRSLAPATRSLAPGISRRR